MITIKINREDLFTIKSGIYLGLLCGLLLPLIGCGPDVQCTKDDNTTAFTCPYGSFCNETQSNFPNTDQKLCDVHSDGSCC